MGDVNGQHAQEKGENNSTSKAAELPFEGYVQVRKILQQNATNALV